MGELIFGESLLHCRALYQPFGEWWIQSNGADALSKERRKGKGKKFRSQEDVGKRNLRRGMICFVFT